MLIEMRKKIPHHCIKFQVVSSNKTSIMWEVMCHIVSNQMLKDVCHHAFGRGQDSLPFPKIVGAGAKHLLKVVDKRLAL